MLTSAAEDVERDNMARSGSARRAVLLHRRPYTDFRATCGIQTLAIPAARL
jgi:hypothetical protein